jgi:hypothetical protein
MQLMKILIFDIYTVKAARSGSRDGTSTLGVGLVLTLLARRLQGYGQR